MTPNKDKKSRNTIAFNLREFSITTALVANHFESLEGDKSLISKRDIKANNCVRLHNT